MTKHLARAKEPSSHKRAKPTTEQKETFGEHITRDQRRQFAPEASPPNLTGLAPKHILRLQRAIGNAAMTRLLAYTPLQRRPASVTNLPAHSDARGLIQREASDESPELQSSKFAGDPMLEATAKGDRFIVQGNQGPAVRKVQEALITVHYPLPVYGADGIFESETKSAVNDYQLDHDITKNGKPYGFVGPRTVLGLDHELVRTDPPPEENVFYQPLLDFLAERGEAPYPYLRKLRDLCQAVHKRKSKKTIAGHVKDLTEYEGRYARINDSSTLPEELVSVEFRSELSARLFMRGMNNVGNEVWLHLRKVREEEILGASKEEKQNEGEHFLTFWIKVIEQAKTTGNLADAKNAAINVAALSRALEGMATAHAMYGDFRRPFLGSQRLREELPLLIKDITSFIQQGIQTIMDIALDELGVGDATTLNTLREVVRGPFQTAFIAVGRVPELAHIELETSRSSFKAKGGTHEDYFASGKAKKARSIEIYYYDNKQELSELTEMKTNLSGVYMARERQLELLDELFGGLDNSRMDKEKLTDAQTANAKAIEGLGGLDLHSDDDWRQFLLSVLEQQDKPDIRELVYLIGRYLKVFTGHTPYNVYDKGVDYLNRPFPRTMHGQLIHDCGVYALRIAYMLSLVKDKLKLEFHAVRLPNHVGLIITGPGQPPVIAQNDEITPIEQDVLDKYWAHWEQSGKPRKFKDATDAQQTQFLADLTAELFIPDVKMPVRVDEFPDISAASRTSEQIKKKLHQFYEKQVSGKDVITNVKGVEQFHLEYLKLLKTDDQIHNDVVLPFWNEKWLVLWDRYAEGKDGVRKLLEQHKNRKTTKDPSQQDLIEARIAARHVRYKMSVLAALTRMEDEAGGVRKEIEKQKEVIRQLLETYPELVAPGATLSEGFGMLSTLTESPLKLIKQYHDELPEWTQIHKEEAWQKMLPLFIQEKLGPMEPRQH